jgi:sporulation integral membrane protein YlbJ
VNIYKKKYDFNTKGLGGCILFFTASMCILCSASSSSQGAYYGLKICSNIIIPSLFPFTVLSILFQKSGGLLWLGKAINKITLLFFGLNGIDFSVILISLVGGYPIGAKIINELYKSGKISKEKGKKLLRFCVNPSPAFFISALGINVLQNKTVGWILLTSNTFVCLILNIIFLKHKVDTEPISTDKNMQNENFSDAFVESVYDAAKIIIYICAFVTLFSSISEIIKPIFKSPKIYSLICPILEISFGISKIKNSGIPIYFYSLPLAFGGISTICQIKQITDALKPSFLEIFFYRITHGFLATLTSFVLFKIFPQNTMVFSNGTEIQFKGYTLFFPSIMLILFSVLFLMFLSPENKAIDNCQNKKYNFEW